MEIQTEGDLVFFQDGNHRFQIPFDRQQMADYLNLDRSALSKELSRMKKEGILDFHKNEFVLKNEML